MKDEVDKIVKKIDLAKAFVTTHIGLFRCPVCGQPFSEVVGYSLRCPNRHGFDLSKKGTLYFLTKNANNEYDRQMLASRQRMLGAGLFDPIVKAIAAEMSSSPETIMDVGCGEATPLTKLLKMRAEKDVAVGFDISKDGINLATQQDVEAFFCVADLAHLPFNDHQFSTIIDLFSPSAYQEFNRVVAPGGKLIKIIPNSGYLHELRQLLYGGTGENSQYSNEKVFDLFKTHYPDARIETLTYEFHIPEGMHRDMMIMTPLHWGRDQREDVDQQLSELTDITVDVSILTNHF